MYEFIRALFAASVPEHQRFVCIGVTLTVPEFHSGDDGWFGDDPVFTWERSTLIGMN